MIKNKAVKVTLLVLLIITGLFHLLVILGIIPFENIWGGRLKDRKEMLQFETFSMAINSAFVVVVLVKSRFLNLNISPKIITILLWLMAILFALNTIGNLFAINNLEKYIATPITFLLSVLCFVLAREK